MQKMLARFFVVGFLLAARLPRTRKQREDRMPSSRSVGKSIMSWKRLILTHKKHSMSLKFKSFFGSSGDNSGETKRKDKRENDTS